MTSCRVQATRRDPECSDGLYKCKKTGLPTPTITSTSYCSEAKDFELACKALGFEDWLTNPDFNTADARDRHKQQIWDRIQKFCIDKTKHEVTDILSKAGVPVAPVLSTKEIMTDQSLYDGNTLVKINQGGKVGEFVTVGVPFTLSISNLPTACPTLGGNTDEVLKSIGYTDEQIASFAKNGTTPNAENGCQITYSGQTIARPSRPEMIPAGNYRTALHQLIINSIQCQTHQPHRTPLHRLRISRHR